MAWLAAHTETARLSTTERAMLTLYDYPPSQNGWKVRLLLNHLGASYRTETVSIFEGAGRSAAFLRISPAGTVPAIRLEDGRTLAESNAILAYLAEGTAYLPSDPFARAKVQQWLHFEQERIEAVIGSLRYWTMTGKLGRRPPELVDMKRNGSLRTLSILETELGERPFLANNRYSIADMAVFAYASRAQDAGLSLEPYPHFREWIARVAAQPGFSRSCTHTPRIPTAPTSCRELRESDRSPTEAGRPAARPTRATGPSGQAARTSSVIVPHCATSSSWAVSRQVSAIAARYQSRIDGSSSRRRA
jgi:glutathione S-transferase